MHDTIFQEISSSLNSPNESVRNKAFSEIMVLHSKSTADSLISLIRSENEVVKIRFFKFIAKYARSRTGLQIVTRFLDDENLQISQEALATFAEIECIGKKDFLLKLLKSSNKDVVEHAIKQVGQRRVLGAIDPLFELYEHADKDRKLLILRSVRAIRGTASIPWLIKEMHEHDEDLLYNILLTLGLFHKYISWHKFIGFLDHSSGAIRKAAIWALGNYSTKTIRDRLLHHYFNEKDTTVRNEIITVISQYRDTKIMHYLLSMAANAQEYTIRLLAESALDRFPKKMLYKLIRKNRRNPCDRTRSVIYEKACQVYEYTHVMRWLISTLRNDPSEQVRAICAESLGEIPDHTIIPHLEHAFLFDSSQTVRYTALLALTRLWRECDWQTINSILEFPEEKYSHAQQIILRFLQKKLIRDNWQIPETLVQRVMYNLYSETVNIRYLSIEILKILRHKPALVALVDIYIRTGLDDERLLVIETIEKIVYTDPEHLFAFLMQSRHNEQVFEALLEIFETIRFDTAYSYEMILQFSTLFVSERKKPMKKRLARTLMNIFEREYAHIPGLVEQENWNWIKIIMECAKYTEKNELKIFGAEIFLNNLSSENEQMQEVAIIMVGALCEQRAVETLTKIAISNKSMKLRELAKISLHQIINKDYAS